MCKSNRHFTPSKRTLKMYGATYEKKKQFELGTARTVVRPVVAAAPTPIHIGYGWNEIISLSRANQCNMLVSLLTPSSHYWTWGPVAAVHSGQTFLERLIKQRPPPWRSSTTYYRELCVRPFRPGKRHIIECLIM